jgi:hypothetical protein
LSSRFYRTALNFPHPSYPKSRTPYQLPTAGPTCHTLLFPSLPTPPTISLSPLVHSPPHPLPTTGSLPSICGGAGLPRRSSKARRRPLPPPLLSNGGGGGATRPAARPGRRPVVLRDSSPGAASAPFLSPGAGRCEPSLSPCVDGAPPLRASPAVESGGGSGEVRSARRPWIRRTSLPKLAPRGRQRRPPPSPSSHAKSPASSSSVGWPAPSLCWSRGGSSTRSLQWRRSSRASERRRRMGSVIRRPRAPPPPLSTAPRRVVVVGAPAVGLAGPSRRVGSWCIRGASPALGDPGRRGAVASLSQYPGAGFFPLKTYCSSLAVPIQYASADNLMP